MGDAKKAGKYQEWGGCKSTITFYRIALIKTRRDGSGDWGKFIEYFL